MKKTFFLFLALPFALSCGGSPVGRACKTTADCEPSYSCFTQVKDGFCTRGCAVEGRIDECPTGTVCAPIAAATLACTPTCTDPSQCGAHTCAAVNGYDKLACRTP